MSESARIFHKTIGDNGPKKPNAVQFDGAIDAARSPVSEKPNKTLACATPARPRYSAINMKQIL
ncbi:MAG TPA: hypothetical protein ENI55_05775 [Alphaproteobacteria bacterium]|nr:hypothetical protein [Alphaproteobacteria bacterium]